MVRSSRFVGAVFGAAVTLASGAPTGVAAGAESGDEDVRRYSSPVLVAGGGRLLCFATELDACLEDPRAAELRLLVVRLAEREAWAATRFREWMPADPLEDGTECLASGVISCGALHVTAEGLDGTLGISSQVVRLEVTRVGAAFLFPEAEEVDPDRPGSVRIETLIEATMVSMDTLSPEAAYVSPGTEVWVSFAAHEPIAVGGQALCSHGRMPLTLGSLSPGDTLYLFPRKPAFGFSLDGPRPFTSVAYWDDVAIFAEGGPVRQLPFSVDGGEEANPLTLDDFDWLVSRAVARAQTR